MQKIIAALALTGASAFVAPKAARAGVAVQETKADLEKLAVELNPIVGFWDPLSLADAEFWDTSNEQTIGFLRHAEIKHGRVAMAGFLGFIAGCSPLVSGAHAVAPYRGYVAGGTPFEQWDNMPLLAKAQIFIAIGMLESYGEGAGNPEGYVHYTRGGLPGDFPEIAGRAGFGQVGLNLFDPFNWFDTFYPGKDKVRGGVPYSAPSRAVFA